MIGRDSALYLSPDGSFTAGLAGFRRRAGAAAIDWAICVVVYLLASIPAGIVQVLPAGGLFLAGQAVAVAPVVAYFAYFYATGSTLGMRAPDVELAVAATGLPPGRVRALGRAGVALLLGASVYVLYFLLASYDEPLGGYTVFDRTLILVAIALASAGAASKLWGLVDPRRQPLDMKLFGLVVIEEIVETHPAPSPWSGLWRRAP